MPGRSSPSGSNSSGDGPGSTTPTNDQLQAKRRRFTRSKNGCRTCKARKVRCDERRPTCQRCETEDRECLGYSGPPIPRIADARAAQSLRQAADGLTSLGSMVVHGTPGANTASSSNAAGLMMAAGGPSQLEQSLSSQGVPVSVALPFVSTQTTASVGQSVPGAAPGLGGMSQGRGDVGPTSSSSYLRANPQLTTHQHQQQQHLGAASELSQLDDWLSRMIDTTHPSMTGAGATSDPNHVAATAWNTSNLFEWMPPDFSSMYGGTPTGSEGMGQQQPGIPGVPQSILFQQQQQHSQQALHQHSSASQVAQSQQQPFLSSTANMPFRAASANGQPQSRHAASSSPSAMLRSIGPGGRPSYRNDERASDSTLQQRLKQLCTSPLQLEAVSRFFNHVARCFHLLPTDVNNWRLVYAELCCSSELTFKLVTAVGLVSLSLCGPRNRRPLAYAMLTQCLGEWQRLVRRGEAAGWKKGGLSEMETLEVLAGAIMIGHFEQFDNGIANHTISCMSVCRDLIDFAISAPPAESPVDQGEGSAFRFCVRAFLWWDTLSRTMGPGSGGDYPRKLFDAVRAWEDAETEDVTEMVQCICGWPLDLLEAVARTTALSQAVRSDDVMSPVVGAAGGMTPNGAAGSAPSFPTLTAPTTIGSAQSILSLSPYTEEAAVAEARSIETQIRCSRPRAVLQDTMLTAELRYIIFEVLQAGALVYFSRVLIADGDTKRVQPEINQVVRFLRRRDVPASTHGHPATIAAGDKGPALMLSKSPNIDTPNAPSPGVAPGASSAPSQRSSRSLGAATTPATSATPTSAARGGVQEATSDDDDDDDDGPSSPRGEAREGRAGRAGGGGDGSSSGDNSSQSNSPRQRPALLSAEVEKKGLWRERAPDGALLWSYIQAAQVCDEGEETSCRATIERWRKFADCGALDLYPELLEEIWVRRRSAKSKGVTQSADEIWAAVVRDRRWKQLLLF